MTYKPKIVTGKVTGTGYPIDGHVLYFSLWDYDNHENFHLYGWDDADDEAVMLTMYQAEREDGLCTCDTPDAFAEKWKAREWEPAAAFCLPLDKVEVQEVKQEEEKSDAREKLLARGIDLSPRKNIDPAVRWGLNLANLNAGAFGSPEDPETLLRYWKAQEAAGYPGASENVLYFKSIKEKESKT